MGQGFKALAMGTLLLTPAVPNAELLDRGNGLIYDNVLNVTWLKDANYAQTFGWDTDGLMDLDEAWRWAVALNVAGYQDWRLPNESDFGPPGCTFSTFGTDCGYNVLPGSGEIAHLWYATLGNKAFVSASGVSPQPGWGFVNKAPFVNAQAFPYWYSSGWYFNANVGYQSSHGIDLAYVWLVRDGDSSAGIPAESLDGRFRLLANPDVFLSDTVPHITLHGSITSGHEPAVVWYSFRAKAGSTFFVDHDDYLGDDPFGSRMFLFRSSGELIAESTEMDTDPPIFDDHRGFSFLGAMTLPADDTYYLAFTYLGRDEVGPRPSHRGCLSTAALVAPNGEAGGVRFAGCTDRAFALAGMDDLEGDGFTIHVSLLEPRTPPVTTIQSLTLSKNATSGCLSVTGSIALTGPAPSSGLSVALTENLASASMSSAVTVPAGATSKTFTIKTLAVALEEIGTVSATLAGKSLSQSLTVRPMGLYSVTLSPTTVTGGKSVAGTAKLVCKSGPGPTTVELSSSNPALANPVATSVIVPHGLQSVPFTVATNQVLSKASAVISGTANATTKSKTLAVTTLASIGPTSLKFGSHPIGTTSAVQAATLTNKGAVAFSVGSIGVTGSYASWFEQTSDCPAMLDAGASCTISVTFKPVFAAYKTAKLSVSTGATAAPLSVSLSGTGVTVP